MDTQLQPWHIYTAIFVTFWALSAYFDNFFITAVLCVAGGFGSDTFRRYLADGNEEAGGHGGHGDSSVKDVFVAPTKPLPPEPEVSDVEVEKSNKDNEDEEKNVDDIETEHQSILDSEAPSETREVFEEENHLEQVDLLSNVPMTQPNVSEDETHIVDERIGEDNHEEEDEDEDSLNKFEAVSSHDLAQQQKDRLDEDILEPNEVEIEESCHVAEAAKQLESGHHETAVGDDDDDSSAKFESVSKHDLDEDDRLEEDDETKPVESSQSEVEGPRHGPVSHPDPDDHPVHHEEQRIEDDLEDKEPEQSDEEEDKDAKEEVQHKEDLLSREVLQEHTHQETRSEPHLEEEAFQNERISPTQHSEQYKDDEDFDKLSEHSSVNDEPKHIRDTEEEPLAPSLISPGKLVSQEERLDREEDEEYPAEKTAYHPPSSSKDFLSDFEPVVALDVRSRGKLEKVFDPNETVEENSSFEDEILGPNRLVGSDDVVRPQSFGSEDVPEFSPIRSDPPESFSSSKNKDLFDVDNAHSPFQLKPNEDQFDSKEARNDSFASENYVAEPEHLLAFDSPTSPAILASPFQSKLREEKFASEKLEFVSELSSFDSGPISDKFEPEPLTSFGTKDVEEKMIPSSFDARPLDVHHKQQPSSHEVKSESFEDEDKLSFLLEDAQRDESDDEVQEEEDDEDELAKGHPSLEDEGDPWRAPRREPLDSAGESLSHPDSEDLPSRDDVSHRAVFGDDIDEEELLEEIESEEKIEEDDEEVEVALSGKESSSDDDSEGPDQVDSDDQVELMETEQDIKKIPSATTGASKLFDTDDKKEENLSETKKFDQPEEVSIVKQEDKSSLDQMKAEPEMRFTTQFEDPVVKPEIKFAAVEKMSPSFEEAKLISPVTSHQPHEESSFGSSSVFQEAKHDFHETNLLNEGKTDSKLEELRKDEK